ncbi:MAG: carboxypeptidase regulatory-like domain-containing protein [Xanthobacteraceae bacterium]
MKSATLLGASAALAIALCQIPSNARAGAQEPAAIAGKVSSADGAMEGVVVTAHKHGSIVSVSVITDAKGAYAFPEDRLAPGHYELAIRAAGYDLAAPGATDVVSEQTAHADLNLVPTKQLADQLTDGEWMMSIPGSDDQKAALLNCTSCHTLERVMLSTHDVDEWMQTVHRMMGYGAVSQPIKPQPMLDRTRAGTPEQYRKLADYLATINLSAADKWSYPLKTLPRPTGDSTRVIITEYSMPRPAIEPHDIIRDHEGNIWYTDFGELFISKFDPKTLKLTEYPLKKFKPGAPVGELSLQYDRKGLLWFDMMYQGSLGAINPQTGEIKYYPLPAQWNDDRV